ncbi:hypothetical protein BX666DRAFT_1858172 [Dichotomocladium elegans]|nr:hypothetical protein BX666DRAFT_1858172 [Dichotomocladium elegans]
MDPVLDKNTDSITSTEKKLEDLYKLLKDHTVCMMTTRCAESGRLVSRAMAPCPPSHDAPADLWFFSNNVTQKFKELDEDPNVNLAYYDNSTTEWVSISGKARVVNDRQKIKELYTPMLKAWFGDLKDGVHDGSQDDPRISLIHVEAETVHYMLKDKTVPVMIWRVAKSMWSGDPPKIASTRELDPRELQHARDVSSLENSIID